MKYHTGHPLRPPHHQRCVLLFSCFEAWGWLQEEVPPGRLLQPPHHQQCGFHRLVGTGRGGSAHGHLTQWQPPASGAQDRVCGWIGCCLAAAGSSRSTCAVFAHQPLPYMLRLQSTLAWRFLQLFSS